jgi:hypothetical protein
MVQDVVEAALEHVHGVLIIGEGHLHIHLPDLVEVRGLFELFSPEHRHDGEHPFKGDGAELLVELRGLRQVRLFVEVGYLEELGAPLTGRPDDDRRMAP